MFFYLTLLDTLNKLQRQVIIVIDKLDGKRLCRKLFEKLNDLNCIFVQIHALIQIPVFLIKKEHFRFKNVILNHLNIADSNGFLF